MTASLAARHTWLIMYIVYMSRMIIVDLLLHDVDFFVLFFTKVGARSRC